MATINLGRVAYVNRGAYDSAMTYEKHDVVTYNNGSYVFIGSTPAAGKEPTNSGYWMPMLDPTSVNKASDRANAAAEAAEEATANIQNEVNSKAVAISETASGDVVHITNCGAAPVQSLVTHIEPVQSGTGDPSPDNVRPISGWDSVTAQRVQKNVADTSPGRVHSGYYTDNEGKISANANYVRVAAIPVMPGTTYTISSNLEIYSVWFGQGDKRTDRKSVSSGNKVTVTTKANDNRLYITLKNTSGAADITAFEWLQVELGSTATAYEPYQGQTLTAALPETVYGGMLDWTTGVVTVDRKQKQINQVNTLYNSPGDGHIGGQITVSDMKSNSRANGMCDKLTPVTSPSNQAKPCITFGANSKMIYFILPSTVAGTTLETLNAYLAENPLTVVYPLETPYTIQLTPQQLETLKGVNNIWSDAGATEVVYTLDTRTYIDRVEEKIQALSAVVAPSIFVDASGDMVHITDGAEGMPVQSLITHVEPVQEGSGDLSPDNIRNIIGWNEVGVTGAGKNLFGGETLADRFQSVMTVTRDDEARTISFKATNASGKVFFTDFKPDTRYTIILYGRNGTGVTNTYIRYTDGTTGKAQFVESGADCYAVYTTGAGKSVEAFMGSYSNGTTVLYYDKCGIFEGVLTEADFAEYQGKTLTAELPETLYGFDKNWTTGLVSVSYGVRVLTGDEMWAQLDATNNPNLFYFYDAALNGASGNNRTSDCSHYKWSSNVAIEPNTQRLEIVGTGTAVRWYVNSAEHNVLASWKSWLAEQYAAGTPVTVVYELAEPYTIQLTPQQLSTLKGMNNIWSDAGATEVTYAADTKMYIDQKIAAIAAAIV